MSSRFPTATYKDHEQFCKNEEWTNVSKAKRSGKSNDHTRFELRLPDGRILRTKISHPINKRKTYGADLWSRILRDQLQVKEDEFWACVNDDIKPTR